MESPPGIINTLRDYWDIYGKTLGNDEDLAGSGVQTCYADIFENEPEYKDIWSLYKSPHKPDASVPFPKLKETIDRMSEGDAFAAWIWGTYSQVYQGRQIFWVYGPEGEEGKSYLGKFLGKELFGENAGYRVINNLKTKSRNQFTTAAYIGAKLIVYPDCNDRRVLWTELFKSLAGGGRDSEVVEEKYGSSNTVTLDARGIIISNQLPELKRENWLLSRLALCRIDPMKDKKNPNIDKIYLEELPGFLAYAKDCYERLCPDNEAIKLKPETKKWIEEIIDQQDPWLKDVFVRYFELDNNSVVTFKRMKEIMELSEGMKGMDYKNWCEWLTHQVPGVTIVKRSNGFCFKGIYESKEGKVVLTTNVNEAFKEIDARMEQTITFEEMEEAFKDVT
jgi:phage/plasmid-associated DNA primase